jgi:hypothetical protein
MHYAWIDIELRRHKAGIDQIDNHVKEKYDRGGCYACVKLIAK